MRALAVSATIGAAAGWLFEASQQARNIVALLVIFLLGGCANLIPTAAQQGGIDSMFSCVTFDPQTGHKTGEFRVHRDAIDRQLNFKKLEVNEPAGQSDVFAPCRILVEGYQREQGDASITSEAIQLQAARDAALLKAAQESLWEALRAAGVLRPPE